MFIISNDTLIMHSVTMMSIHNQTPSLNRQMLLPRTWLQTCGHTLTHATAQAHALSGSGLYVNVTQTHMQIACTRSRQVEEPISNLHAKIKFPNTQRQT